MADEINRASPRTQSALLQSMQEYHVTIAGQRYDLPAPFHVLATQNPLEQEGTYPLPEAQLDRFLLQVDVDYPNLRDRTQGSCSKPRASAKQSPHAVIDAERLMEIQKLIRRMPVSDGVVDAILSWCVPPAPVRAMKATDKHASPGVLVRRAGQAMMLCARARALREGRLAPSLDDVHALAEPVLEHRMALTFAARAEGMSVRDVIAGLIKQSRS